jgi:hypothetical protein
MTHIILKDGKPSLLYTFTKDAPGQYIPGVAARDLTDEDWASYSEDQRAALERESKRKDGAYKKVGTTPHLHGKDPEPVEVDLATEPEPAPVPAETSGKKE